MTIGEREKEGEGGGFSRDECLVIAARGSTVPLSFIHLPLAASREQIGPGSVHYQCIAARPSIELFDAASKQAESPSSLSPFGIYIDEYDAVCVCVCVPTCTDSCQSRCIDPFSTPLSFCRMDSS